MRLCRIPPRRARAARKHPAPVAQDVCGQQPKGKQPDGCRGAEKLRFFREQKGA